MVRNFFQLGVLSSVCDRNTDVSATLEREYAGVRYCSDYDAILHDPEITAVALSTPALTHHHMAKAALEAGKDVYVEKPLAVDVREAQELVELAEEGDGR